MLMTIMIVQLYSNKTIRKTFIIIDITTCCWSYRRVQCCIKTKKRLCLHHSMFISIDLATNLNKNEETCSKIKTQKQKTMMGKRHHFTLLKFYPALSSHLRHNKFTILRALSGPQNNWTPNWFWLAGPFRFLAVWCSPWGILHRRELFFSKGLQNGLSLAKMSTKRLVQMSTEKRNFGNPKLLGQ